jgi:hypothetical protein
VHFESNTQFLVRASSKHLAASSPAQGTLEAPRRYPWSTSTADTRAKPRFPQRPRAWSAHSSGRFHTARPRPYRLTTARPSPVSNRADSGGRQISLASMSEKCQEPTWRQIERGQFAGVSGTNALHRTGTTRRTPHHSRCLCSVSLESSSAITVYSIVQALQSKQSDQADLFL